MSFSKFDFTEKYWNGLSDKSRALYEQIRPMVRPRSACSYRLGEIEATLERFREDCEAHGGSAQACP